MGDIVRYRLVCPNKTACKAVIAIGAVYGDQRVNHWGKNVFKAARELEVR